MSFFLSEILQKIEECISKYYSNTGIATIGRVLNIRTGIIRAYDLGDIKVGEMCEFPASGIKGMVIYIRKGMVGIVVFGDNGLIKKDDIVKRLQLVVDVRIVKELLGFVVYGFSKVIADNQVIQKDIRQREYVIINTLYKILSGEPLKDEETSLDFELFKKVFLIHIPNFSNDVLVKKNQRKNFDLYKTPFFLINYDFSGTRGYSLTDLEIQYILEKMYPLANLEAILTMRSEIECILINLGFPFKAHLVRISDLLPTEYATKLISSGQYRPVRNTIVSYVFPGIRLRTSEFKKYIK
jgi:hypothetical protein